MNNPFSILIHNMVWNHAFIFRAVCMDFCVFFPSIFSSSMPSEEHFRSKSSRKSTRRAGATRGASHVWRLFGDAPMLGNLCARRCAHPTDQFHVDHPFRSGSLARMVLRCKSLTFGFIQNGGPRGARLHSPTNPFP